MYLGIIKLFLSFFDSFKKKKVLNFFQKNLKNNISLLVDVGAHYGETIKEFKKNFEIDEIIAFEPSPMNFKKLLENTSKIKNLRCFQLAMGENKDIANFTQHYESSSSTLTELNQESTYYKKKNSYFNIFNLNNLKNSNMKVQVDRLDNILNDIKIDKIDVLKIDTEGYDFQVIKGLGKYINNVQYIYFEHHFHNMLKKNYSLNDVHSFMIKNNFKKAFKIKMFFRKTFEYIYFNESFKN